MSDSSAVWNSLMNSAHVVCIDQRLTMPSRTLKRRTNSMIRSVRSTSSMRWSVSMTKRLAVNRQAAGRRGRHLRDGRLADGDGRTLAHALLDWMGRRVRTTDAIVTQTTSIYVMQTSRSAGTLLH